MTKLALAMGLFTVALLNAAGRPAAPVRRHNSAAAAGAMPVISVAQARHELQQPRARKWIQVGFRVLYKGAHIPGSIYAGPASTPSGLRRLRHLVKAWPRTASIVIYCGCCPFRMCPNIRPAYALLHGMGFTHIQVLDLPQGLDRDWIQKGLPVRSQG